MAVCTLDLFGELGGSPDTGGYWEQTSGPQSITLSGGHLGTASFLNAAAGTYTFDYKFNEVDAPATVTVTVGDRPDPGNNTSLNTTEGAGVITLLDQLDGTPDAGGSWTVLPAIPAGTFNAGAGTYDPASGDGSLEGTVYVFTYSVTEPGSDADCACCTQTADLTITVFQGGTVGTDASSETETSDGSKLLEPKGRTLVVG